MAAEALKFAKRGRIHTGIGTSWYHIHEKLNSEGVQKVFGTLDLFVSLLETEIKYPILQRGYFAFWTPSAVEAVKYARRFVDDVEFYAEDAGRTEEEYLAG